MVPSQSQRNIFKVGCSSTVNAVSLQQVMHVLLQRPSKKISFKMSNTDSIFLGEI